MLPEYLRTLGVDYHIIEQDTYSVVKRADPAKAAPCAACARACGAARCTATRRENGITRIALGHHRDDIVETLFLNLFHGGKLKAMAPKLRSDDGRHIVIRPLAYVAERDIARYAAARDFPDHSLRPVRFAGEPAARARSRRCSRTGSASIRGAPNRCSPRCATWSRRTLADPKLFDFAGLAAGADRMRSGRRLCPTATGSSPAGCWRASILSRRTARHRTRRVQLLLAAGVRTFIDLTRQGERPDYSALLPPDASYHRLPIPDHSVPESPERMREIQRVLARGAARPRRGVYVHCRAGLGRTGTTMGCYLRERGRTPEQALAELNALWQQNACSALWPRVPETARAGALHPRLDRGGGACPGRLTRSAVSPMGRPLRHGAAAGALLRPRPGAARHGARIAAAARVRRTRAARPQLPPAHVAGGGMVLARRRAGHRRAVLPGAPAPDAARATHDAAGGGRQPDNWMMRILRHEVGHAIDTAYPPAAAGALARAVRPGIAALSGSRTARARAAAATCSTWPTGTRRRIPPRISPRPSPCG